MNRNDLAKEIINYRDEGLTIKKMSVKMNLTFEQVRYITKKENIPMLVNPIKQCEVCGKEFKAKRRTAKTCCRKCSDKLYEQNRTVKHKYTCEHCGKEFEHTNRKTVKFCSEKCLAEYNKQELFIREQERLRLRTIYNKCSYCGATFATTKSNVKYCSDDCRILHGKTLAKERYVITSAERLKNNPINKINKRCKECGKHFSTTYSNKIFCSNKCKRKNNYRINEINRRNKIIENGSVDWSISVERLYRRDKGTCYLCNGQCDMNDYYVNDNDIVICGNDYPSIDHVIPISKGGTHSWDNVRLAHRHCNAIKRDALLKDLKTVEK